MDKVIEFPKHKVVREIPEEVHLERQAKADQKLADTIVEEIGGLMVTELDNYYIDVTNKTFAKDFILVIDSLKSAIYRQMGIDHHLQGFVDNNIKILEGIEDNMTTDEIREKIDSVIKDLIEASEKLDKDEEE